jgi:hypothetical protein
VQDEMAAGYVAGARCLLEGDQAGAVRRLEAAVDAELRISGTFDDLHVYWPLAVRAAALADDAEALGRLVSRIDVRRVPQGTSLAGHALVFRAVLATRSHSADVAGVETDFREGIAVLDRCGVAVWRAHAQEDFGTWLLGQGRTDEAATQLAAARATYEQVGASAWQARVDRVALVSESAS